MSKRIFLDFGHRNNEWDFGATGNGLKESELVLKIGNHTLSFLLENYTGFIYKLSRVSENESIDLNERVKAANVWGANIFVSFHINAGGGTGFETLIFNGDMGKGEVATVSLQNIIHEEVFKTMKTFGVTKDRGKKRGNFAVLRDTNAPAVLTESLFIDNVTDAKLLKNELFLKAVGEAHGRAIAKYLGLPTKQKAVKPMEPKQPDYKGHWAEKSIQKAIDNNVLQGYTDGNFGPNDPLTRAQFAVVLDRLGLLEKEVK